jgi:exopolysaccharide production protein ExoZ
VNTPISRNYYYGLDAVRFSAALLVASFHLGFWSWASGDETATILDGAARFEPIAFLTWFGWVGVEIFFVISGFVIANSAHGASAIDFLKGRVLRLYPAAWVCATCTLITLTLANNDQVPVQIWPYIASVALWIRGPWIDSVYWTLAVEIAFYALIFVVLTLGRFNRINRIAWFLTIYSGTFVLCLALNRSGTFTHLGAPAHLGDKLEHVTSLSLARHGCLFAVGIWIWLASTKQMLRAGWAGLAIAMLAGATEVVIRIPELLVYPAATGVWLLSPLIVWLVATAFIIVFVLDPSRFTPATTRGKKFLRTIGLMTYPLYLLHNLIGAALIRGLVADGANQWVALAAATLILLAMSLIVCKLIEPVLKSLLRLGFESVERKTHQTLAGTS